MDILNKPKNFKGYNNFTTNTKLMFFYDLMET